MTPLNVALLWHQHQPLYRNPRSGRHVLPWTRLHALKDYYDMAAIAGDYPDLHLTFNLVPSLLDQLDEYAAGVAIDPALELAHRSAGDLDEAERRALLDLFFSAPHRTMIAPFPRYAALYHKRGRRLPDGGWGDAQARFSVDDLRDLQVWFHLAWSGPALRRCPEIAELLRKGDHFTEEEKAGLLAMQAEFLKEVVPAHRRLVEDGSAEISTSPYYHPILPLLCDLESAREAVPALPLPDARYRHPEDARRQIAEALDEVERRMGRRPAGMWPSEGSLSGPVLAILSDCGVRWTASDEEVLAASAGRSLAPGERHRAWRLDGTGGGGTGIFLLDRTPSGLPCFPSPGWPAGEAASDFLSRLRRIGDEAPGGVVSVILDGENAWEHYPDNGDSFLRALYEGLTTAPWLRTVTFAEALDAQSERGGPARLDRLRAGSWIGANLTTWIGHPEKNRAWSMLASARATADAALSAGGEGAAEIWRLIAAAEGSDWFWWYGDDHVTEQAEVFDAAFRDLIRRVHELLGMEAPRDLDLPIKRAPGRPWAPPTGPVSPVLDGAVTDYFEWLAAGVCDAHAGQGAMHQGALPIRRIAFGTDGSCLFLRVDPDRDDVASVLEARPACALRVEVRGAAPSWVAYSLRSGAVIQEGNVAGARFAAGRVLEIAMPLVGPDPVSFTVTLAGPEGSIQRLPRGGDVTVSPADPYDWNV